MTAEEIIKTLREFEVTPQYFYDEGFDGCRYDLSQEAFTELGDLLGPVRDVVHGIQDDMDSYCIKFFPKHNVYIKMTGQFESYQSIHECEDFGHEVHPKEVTKIIYE